MRINTDLLSLTNKTCRRRKKFSPWIEHRHQSIIQSIFGWVLISTSPFLFIAKFSNLSKMLKYLNLQLIVRVSRQKSVQVLELMMSSWRTTHLDKLKKMIPDNSSSLAFKNWMIHFFFLFLTHCEPIWDIYFFFFRNERMWWRHFFVQNRPAKKVLVPLRVMQSCARGFTPDSASWNAWSSTSQNFC